jgi:hypothetical protein
MSDELKQLKNELAVLATTFKTPKQLDFAKELAKSKSNAQAYVDAGYKSKKPNEDAHKLIESNPTFTQYKKLAQKIAQIELTPKQIATFEQKIALLWRIAQHDSAIASGEDEDGADLKLRDSRSAIAAIAELNKMQGDLASIKVENKNIHAFEELTEAQIDQRIADLQRKA